MQTTGTKSDRVIPDHTMRELSFQADFRVFVIYLCFFTQMLLSDCPRLCECKWKSGKESVICLNANLSSVPLHLEAGTQVLDLTGNNIVTIKHDEFSKAGLLNLQKVYISKCRLRSFERYAFRNLINLVELDLSYNVLSSVPSHIFDSIPELRELKLSGNPISRILNNAFIHVPQLVKLELTDCKINTIERDAFNGLKRSLGRLKLDNNKLSELKPSSITILQCLDELELAGNPWNCSCVLRPLREWMLRKNMPFGEPPVCHHPPRLASKPWDKLDLDEFACAPEILAVDPKAHGIEGKNVTMKCNIDGIPEPTVRWMLKNKVIANLSGTPYSNGKKLYIVHLQNKSSDLTILTAELQDAGVYVCAAENKAGRAEASVTLAVSRKPPQSPLSGKVLIASMVTGGLLVVLSCLMVTCVYSVRKKRSLKWRKRKCRGEENYEKIELNHKVPGSSSSVMVQQEVAARRNGEYRLIPGTDNEQTEKDKEANPQSTVPSVAITSGNGGQITNSWSTNGSKTMVADSKWDSPELSLLDTDDVNGSRNKGVSERDDCPKTCNSMSGTYNHSGSRQSGHVPTNSSTSQLLQKEGFNGFSFYSPANHVQTFGPSENDAEMLSCFESRSREDLRSYPDLIGDSSPTGKNLGLQYSLSGSSNISDVYCTLPRRFNSLHQKKYVCSVTESQSPLLPESLRGSSRDSEDSNSLLGETYIGRRLSDPFRNHVKDLSKEYRKSSSFVNLIDINNENKNSISFPDVEYLDNRVIYKQSSVLPTAVAMYDYHANQLEKFLEEYRSLQEELTKMKETCERLEKEEIFSTLERRGKDSTSVPSTSQEKNSNTCLNTYLSKFSDLSNDKAKVMNS